VQALSADGSHCVRPTRELVEVATPERAALGTRKDQRSWFRPSEQGQMLLQHRPDHSWEAEHSSARLGRGRAEQDLAT
jgi:hypothetical protein